MKKLNSKEILNLSKDEFIKYMDKIQRSSYDKNFLASLPQDYEKLTYSTKLNFWVENINQSMRLQVEKGLDEYILFTPEWYLALKKNEPRADDLMNDVFQMFSSYGWGWDRSKFLKRISQNE